MGRLTVCHRSQSRHRVERRFVDCSLVAANGFSIGIPLLERSTAVMLPVWNMSFFYRNAWPEICTSHRNKGQETKTHKIPFFCSWLPRKTSHKPTKFVWNSAFPKWSYSAECFSQARKITDHGFPQLDSLVVPGHDTPFYIPKWKLPRLHENGSPKCCEHLGGD